MAKAILWFRNDLRLADNPALQALLRAGFAPVPVYIHAPAEEGDWAPGAASEAWRARALQALDAALRARGSRLHVFRGGSLDTLQRLATQAGAEAVFWNRRYEPAIERRDTDIKRALRQRGLHAESHNGSLLIEPWQVATRAGDPYRVFTPFWRAASALLRLPPCTEAPGRLSPCGAFDGEVDIPTLGLSPSPAWDAGFWKRWVPGEQGGGGALRRFLDDGLVGYGHGRDLPALRGTSRLSPHLHFGEIAPWRIVRAVRDNDAGADAEAFVRELGWREFAHHVLHHFPRTPTHNFDPRFDDFAWARRSPAKMAAWQSGRTGVPIVDAGMRELWATGWMHNRVRMVVASFLAKHLRMHWREGARWFWDTLVDADLANNTLGWQWTAGTGVDAAPYFRVFNPVLQSRRFDPAGEYLARWIPELAALPAKHRHAPWLSTDAARLGRYPSKPVIDLAEGRGAALAAFGALRRP